MEKSKGGMNTLFIATLFLALGVALTLIVGNIGLTGNAIFKIPSNAIIEDPAPICTNECFSQGYYCVNNSYKANCVDDNQDGCLESIEGEFCSLGYVCSNRECISNITNVTCWDSDGGINYQVKGTAISTDTNYIPDAGTTNRFTDTCGGLNSVNEFYCEGNILKTIGYAGCSYGCSNGACLTQQNITNVTCWDSDGGFNLYLRGTASNGLFNKTDVCTKKVWNGQAYQYEEVDNCFSNISECYVDEAVCLEDGSVGKGGSGQLDHKCSYGCSNGACLPQSQEVTYKGVLQMLNKCSIEKYTFANQTNVTKVITGSEVCNYFGKTCVAAEICYYMTPENYYCTNIACNIYNDPKALRATCC